jgi:hypothetical protein
MPSAHTQQQQCPAPGRGVLETLVTVGVVVVRIFFAVVAGQQHHEVGHQIGQRVDAVGDQALGLGHDADGNLGDRQDHIDPDTDPGAARCGSDALGGAVLGVFVVVVKFGVRWGD